MTREENIRAILESNFAGYKEEVIDIAVKRICELEQEPCEDCLFKNEWQKIGKLISVILEKQTEQELIGHWIMHDRHRECSKCGVWLLKDMPRNSYCPNCGARMESEVEHGID